MKPMSGILGEVMAARLLRDAGYTLLAANFSCRFGELDIVASTGDVVAVIEVKSRLENSLFAPAAAVTADKIRKIKLATQVYIKSVGYEGLVRFDVIEVLFDEQINPTKINHIINCF